MPFPGSMVPFILYTGRKGGIGNLFLKDKDADLMYKKQLTNCEYFVNIGEP